MWPRSAVTSHYHKTAFPENAGKNSKFALVFGDSHLRSLVDGYVQMPEGDLRFGYSSTPGAYAAALRKEVLNETLPEEPDLVCLIAPGNNLSNNTIQQAGKEFASLICSAQGRWNKVVVIDFPNRLTVEFPYQDMLPQEYHRAAASMNVRYLSTVDHFPARSSDLWCRDGVHLSDDHGMPIFAQLIWCAAYYQLNVPQGIKTQTCIPQSDPTAGGERDTSCTTTETRSLLMG
ncbi:uncharacterized protein LOC131705260 isoform X1 [Acipenser ruthenus]|uniref:uncharacterized protein LOC131705260 isoform X1 n=2 Tax=Acipenser ruthenus TaxID=7906 RepID=UPI0027404D57|nr:uncharacterized protein LOC131705260 isoform X1 [Acipenser ruthenus]XP_058863627.1 uncharacterized protein LOC131705260 isoform X1 [Acipenser ruthenus]